MSETKYRIPTRHYRKGMMFPAGAIISVPSDEKVPDTWEKVKKSEGLTDPATPANADKRHAPKIRENDKTI